MSPVWKPRTDPPKLDKFCYLSHDAQKVMLALYTDYLHQRAEIVETQRVISNPRNYYQSIYEARFGSGPTDRSDSASIDSTTGFKSSDSALSTPAEKLNSAATSSHPEFTARRLDFRQMEGQIAERSYANPGFQNTTPDLRKKQHPQTSSRLTVSPDVSNYSDSPPVETQDFRILSQFQRDDTISTLSSPGESSSQNVQDIAMTATLPAYSASADFEASHVGTDISIKNLGQASETSANDNLDIQLHCHESVQNDCYQGVAQTNIMANVLEECPVSPSLFSQDVQRTRSKIAHSAQRKRVEKRCVKLQNAYQSHRNFAGHNNGGKPVCKITKEQSEDLTVAEFNKMLTVSPEGELRKNNETEKQSHTRHAATNKGIGKIDGELNFLAKHNSTESGQYHTGQCSTNALEALNESECGHSRHEVNMTEEESEDPLCRLRDTADKEHTNGGRSYFSRAASVEITENPLQKQPGKVYPIFNKPDANQSLRSVKTSDQVKRKPSSSQGFDAPFKKQKMTDHRPHQQTHTSHSPVSLVNILDLPSSELSLALSDCLEAEQVAISLVYTDGATQLRPNMFGQETKKRPSGRQKLPDSSVCDVAIATKTSGYRRVYIFPVAMKNGETHWTLKYSKNLGKLSTKLKFWKELMGSPGKKVGFNTKSLFLEMMKVCGTENREGSRIWTVLDVSIGVWLLDPDKPVATFQQAVSRLGLPPQEPSDSSVKALSSDMLLLNNASDKLHQELKAKNLLDVYLDLETPLTPLLAAMERREIQVATHTLLKFSEILKKKLQKLEQQAHQAAGHPFLLSSHAQLRQVLFETLRLDLKLPQKTKLAKTTVGRETSTSEAVLHQLSPHHLLPGIVLEHRQKTKLAKTTVGRETSTSEAVLHQLSPHHSLPGIVLDHRQLQKLKSTYVDGMLSCVCEGRLRTHWDQTAAATGRLTSHQPNVQAIPKTPVTITHYKDNFIAGKEDTEEVEIYARDCFVSRPGYSLLAADFQQIELRLLGHLTRDPVLVQIFSDPHIPDIFNALTAQWLGKTPEEVTAGEREQTKRVVYSVMYGVGKDKLAEYLKISPDTARGIMTSFLVKFPAVNQFTKACVDFCQKHGFTETIFQRRRLFPNMKHPSAALRAQAERQCVNFCIQGSAADLCKAAMLRLDQAFTQRRELEVRLLVQIHDELLFEVADQDLHSVTAVVTEVMESRDKLCGSLVSLSVPIPVSVSVGKSWGHMEAVADTHK